MGDRSCSNCARAGSTRANCSGLEIPKRRDVLGNLGSSPDVVSHGLWKSISPSTWMNSPTMLVERAG